MTKPTPCRCERLHFPHRFAPGPRGCPDAIVTDDDIPDKFEEDERRLDERDRARYVNALNRGAAK